MPLLSIEVLIFRMSANCGIAYHEQCSADHDVHQGLAEAT